MICVFVRAFVQHARQKLARIRLRIPRHLLWRPARHHASAAFSALRPEIDHPIRRFNHVQIVLDDQHRGPAFKQFAKCRQQF